MANLSSPIASESERNGMGGESRGGSERTCQSLLRRFLALFFRVVVSLMRFHSRPGPSFLFTTSSARVAQNAPPSRPPPAIAASRSAGSSSSCCSARIGVGVGGGSRVARVQEKVWVWALVGPRRVTSMVAARGPWDHH